ncbi:MAG: FAD-dependent thymidylate synthase, partial [Candidatus Bathyarchaeota archaeon]|nr:FAD-dependent thymidylate synthase [Candidatus Bathyarchaeota archaeon]
MTSRFEEIEEVRRSMRTYPDAAPREDKIYFDLHHLKVEIVDKPKNPYKAMYILVTSTWSSRSKWWERWEDATVEGRMKVVQAVLEGKTLPAALECPSFTFKIQGMSRSSFDQLARERYSAIGSMGMRDDAHLDAALVLPPKLLKYRKEIGEWWKHTKDLYQKMVQDGKESWQTARFIIPMGVEWRFTWTMNYRALQNMLSKRMCFSEQLDTVAVAWKIWHELYKAFPLLAAYCRPSCDRAKRCLYSEAYSLSEMFGNLFLP